MDCIAPRIWRRLMRRKIVRDEDLEKTDLSRCLTLLDLTALGIGSTLGAGAYVIAGQVAKQDAGPAVVISFFIAAVASVLAGLCYAEFGARVPKAGSAYVYTYVTVGELMAFVIGWNLILEYVIGAASVARTASGYLDDLIGDHLVPWFNETMPMNVESLADYVDLLALGITMLLTIILSIGVKESAIFTKIFTGLNLIILGYVIIAGAFQDDPKNWNIPPDNVPPRELETCGNKHDGCGKGGFAPYGMSGIMKGAATCFFAFVGFDAIATTSEEAKNPQRNIPLATIISLGIVFAMYFAISLTITMMVPYYALDMQAPIATVFANHAIKFSKYIVAVGAICALTTSLLGSMIAMPRVILAMARDGLIFKFFAYIQPRLKTPVIATLVSGSLAALMAAIFDVDALVEMMSIGTLLAYTLVSASVLLLRYEPPKASAELMIRPKPSIMISNIEQDDFSKTPVLTINGGQYLNKRISLPNDQLRHNGIAATLFMPSTEPTVDSAKLVKILTIVLITTITGICCLLKFAARNLFENIDWWAWALFVIFVLIILLILVVIIRQPQSAEKLSFRVPFIPIFPTCSIFFNIYLMVNLDPMTWIRFLVWMAIGFAIYFAYGMSHSIEERRKRSRQLSLPKYAIDFECGEHPSRDQLLRGDSDSGMAVSDTDGIPTLDEKNLEESEKNRDVLAF